MSADPRIAFDGIQTSRDVKPVNIANAIDNAVGVRIEDLPITPDKILEALKEEQS